MKTLGLCIVLLFASCSFAQTTPDNPDPSVAKIKTEVQRRGVGDKARVRVTLRDNSEVRGNISGVQADSFTIAEQSGAQRTLAYSDVQRVRGAGMSKKTKIWIVVGAAVVVAVLIAAAAAKATGDLLAGPH